MQKGYKRAPDQKLICVGCNVEFIVRACAAERGQKYCGRTCWLKHASETGGRPRTANYVKRCCEKCGKECEIPEYSNGNQKFCSRKCWRLAQSGRPKPGLKIEPKEKICPNCDTKFLVGGRGRPHIYAIYCSNECASESKIIYPEPRDMSTEEIAWFAGMFDGEGTIVWSRPETKAFQIRVTGTCKDYIEKIKEITGTGSITFRKSINSNHHDTWVWASCSMNAAKILKQVVGLLIVKKSGHW